MSAMSSPRRPKRFLTAEQKYDLWQRMLTGQITTVAAAAEAGVDRSTVMTLRKTARDGAIAALQASRPGQPKHNRAEQARWPGSAPRWSGCRPRSWSRPSSWRPFGEKGPGVEPPDPGASRQCRQ